MRRLLRRLVSLIFTLIGVSIVVFILVRLAPGNPAELMLPDDATEEMILAQEQKMGLDKPLVVQYLNYMGGILKGDFGYSYKFGMSVKDLIAARFPQTAKLAGLTLSWMLVFSMALGVIAGINKGKGIDVFSMIFAMLGQSIAPVWLSLMMILLFAVKLNLLPTGGFGSFKYMIMPSLCQGLQSAAIVSRMTRTGMVDVLQEDYITAMRARGVSKSKVYTIYALKNAVLPTVTTVGNQMGHLLAGSAIIESIFSWPGMGQLLIQAIGYRDLQLVQSLLLVSALIIGLCNLLVDFVYTLVDPRISFN